MSDGDTVDEKAAEGAPWPTLPPGVAPFRHALTDTVLSKFLGDWRQVPPARLFSEENLARYE